MTEFVIYKNKNGHYFSDSDVRTCFCMIHGVRPFENEKLFSDWMKYLDTSGILSVANPTDEELVLDGRRHIATMRYRQNNKCSLAEAHTAIGVISDRISDAQWGNL